MKELLLVEEFERSIHPNIRTYLDEHKVETLKEAARKADDYALTHKGSFVKNKPYKGHTNGESSVGLGRNPPSAPPSNDKAKFNSNAGSKQINGGSVAKAGTGSPSGPICNYCKKVGHIMSECWSLQGRDERKKNYLPTALVQQGVAESFAKVTNLAQGLEEVKGHKNGVMER